MQVQLFALTAGSYHRPHGVVFEMRPELPPRRSEFLMMAEVSCIVKSARMQPPSSMRRDPRDTDRRTDVYDAHRCSKNAAGRPPSSRVRGACQCVPEA